jgi:hypothetical protein
MKNMQRLSIKSISIMKKPSFLTTFLFVLYFSTVLNAQEHLFEAGTIFTKNDTLKGFIKRSTDLNLSQSVEFKNTFESTTVKTYTPNNCEGFSFDADKSTHGKVHTRYLKNEKPFSEWRFGRLILKGVTSVYKLRLSTVEKKVIVDEKSRDLYIILKKDTFYTLEIRETLVSKVEVNSSTMMGENIYNYKKTYLPVLQHITRDCRALQRKANDVSFDEQSIVDYFNQYNQCLNPTEATTVFSSKTKAVIGHGIEVPFSIKPAGNIVGIGYFIDIKNPNLNERLHGTIGLDARRYNFKDEKGRWIGIRVVGNYDLVFTQTRQIYFGVGYEYIKSSGQLISTNTNFAKYPIDGFMGLYNLNLGLRSNNFRIELAAEFTGLTLDIDSKVFILNLTAGFYLSKKQAKKE